jgi:hypothetical protein
MAHEQDTHIQIQIDHKHYEAPREQMTGQELRQLAQPPIGEDRDLWEVVHGPADDIKVDAGQTVHVKSGMQFYSAPRTINPGTIDATA